MEMTGTAGSFPSSIEKSSWAESILYLLWMVTLAICAGRSLAYDNIIMKHLWMRLLDSCAKNWGTLKVFSVIQHWKEGRERWVMKNTGIIMGWGVQTGRPTYHNTLPIAFFSNQLYPVSSYMPAFKKRLKPQYLVLSICENQKHKDV